MDVRDPDIDLAQFPVDLCRGALVIQQPAGRNPASHADFMDSRLVFEPVFENQIILCNRFTGRKDDKVIFFESQIFGLHKV